MTSALLTARMQAFHFFILSASLLRTSLCAEWCYASQDTCEHKCKGPDEWVEVASTCGGMNQSPINIVTRRVSTKSTLTPVTFKGYQHMFHSVITNNGHTVKANLSGSALIYGGGLGATYKAIEFHFHWGKNGGSGSEHTVDGEQYPMEMHIVHIKENYNSVEEAVKDPDGLAVLGFFYQESESVNKKYEPIINALGSITQFGNRTTLEAVSLETLLPSNMTDNYFRYNGSLTTPSCSESVIWTVFETPIHLNRKQLSAFSNLHFENEDAMVKTFRPVQPLNGRVVFYSGGPVAAVSTILIVSSFLTTFLTMLE